MKAGWIYLITICAIVFLTVAAAISYNKAVINYEEAMGYVDSTGDYYWAEKYALLSNEPQYYNNGLQCLHPDRWWVEVIPAS